MVKIIRKEIIDAEPLQLTLVSRRRLTARQLERLRLLLRHWPDQKAREEGYQQPYSPRLELGPAGDPLRIRVNGFWFPPQWVLSFGHAVEGLFPSIRKIEVGEDFKLPGRSGPAFVHVPAKVVTLDDGSREHLATFDIARYPVSVDDFEHFTQETGYVTLAERNAYDYNYRESTAQVEIPIAKRGPLPACELCHLDAMAYCAWAGVRLPTEAEWLAGVLLDERVYRSEASFLRRLSELQRRADALMELGREITGTLIDARRVVVRTGPYYARDLGTAPPFGRIVRPVTFYQRLQFRVCLGQAGGGNRRGKPGHSE